MTSAHRNTLVLFALVCAGIAAGCGGSSGGNALTIPTPSPNPTISFPPPPTPLATNNSYRPSPSPSETNLYQFTGFIEESFVRPPVTQSPIPSPNPVNSATIVSTVAQNVQVTSGATFDGIPNLVDYDIVEADVGAYGILSTEAWLKDIYYQYTPNPNGTTSVATVGETSFLDLGGLGQTFFKTTWGSGNGLVDVVPEPSKTGEAVPVLPANNASMTNLEKDPDGQVTQQIINRDGSYTEGATYPDGTSSTATLNSNGTGTYSFPLRVAANSSVTVGSANGGSIPVTVNYAAGATGPGSPPKQLNLSVPDWYPQTPPTLSKETLINFGPKGLPNPYPSPLPLETTGACALGNDINQQPLVHIQQKPYSNDLVQTITKVDPLFGETETTTTSTFVTQGVGPTCWKIVDTLTQYYDYSGQTFSIPYFAATPVQVTTTTITMGIAFATINNQSFHFGDSMWRRSPPNGRQGQSHMRQGRSFGQQARGSPGGGSPGGAGPLGSPQQQQVSMILTALRSNALHQFENARLKRHAAYWRQVEALRMRRHR